MSCPYKKIEKYQNYNQDERLPFEECLSTTGGLWGNCRGKALENDVKLHCRLQDSVPAYEARCIPDGRQDTGFMDRLQDLQPYYHNGYYKFELSRAEETDHSQERIDQVFPEPRRLPVTGCTMNVQGEVVCNDYQIKISKNVPGYIPFNSKDLDNAFISNRTKEDLRHELSRKQLPMPSIEGIWEKKTNYALYDYDESY